MDGEGPGRASGGNNNSRCIEDSAMVVCLVCLIKVAGFAGINSTESAFRKFVIQLNGVVLLENLNGR